MDMKIYFDEAGNSGSNLLDDSQPVYTLISHNYTEEESSSILEPLLDTTRAKELHFKTIKKYHSQQQALINCFDNPLINKDRIRAFVVHKEFLIVIHIVDRLIEEVVYRGGIDLYEGGANISMANMIYILGKNIWNKNKFSSILRLFVIAVRSNETSHWLNFYQSVLMLFQSVKNDEEQLFLGLILESNQYLSEIREALDKNSIDPTFSCFRALCSHWNNFGVLNFTAITDTSKQLEYWKGLIEFLRDDVPDQIVGFGSRRWNSRLQIQGISQIESHSSVSIQFADILASSLNYYATQLFTSSSIPNDSFPSKISEIIEPKVTLYSMLPSADVTSKSLDMEDVSGVNPLDHLASTAQNDLEKWNRAFRKKSN
jgi:hypothetical protein